MSNEATSRTGAMKGVAHAAPERKKYKMSREGYRMTEQILKDSQAERWKNSPIAKVISIEDQARECPDDFTGESKDECAHFDLADPRHQHALPGEYRIVFSRSMNHGQTHNETFKPSSERSVKIFDRNSNQAEYGTAIRDILATGSWAGVELKFNGQALNFGLDNWDHPRDHKLAARPYITNLATGTPTAVTWLGEALENLRPQLPEFNAFAGCREMKGCFDHQKQMHVALGFEFLELELAYQCKNCADREDGSDHLGLQCIVAVKLSDRVKDVGSAMLLMQQI